jgi:WS/DGAT/MGAT family acyltransferase
LIQGLEGDRVGLLTKVHHAAIDGLSGFELLAALLDPSPGGRAMERRQPPAGERSPGQLELLARGLVSLPGQPLRALRAIPTVLPNLDQMPMTRALPGAASLSSLLRRVPGMRPAPADGGVLARPRTRAPRTVFNAPISAQRRFAFGSLPLEAVKRLKRAAGVTVNDVVVALTAATLRSWLMGRDELPGQPLLAMVPVSVRSDAAQVGNRVSTMIVPIPTDEANPRRRLELAHEALRAAKERHHALPATLLQDANEFIPPALFGRASRVIAGLAARDPLEPPCNVVISNVPGPQTPLYCAGARLEAIYPVSAILDGVGLNVTVLGYCGSLDFGIVSDREQVPDPDTMIDGLGAALEELSAVFTLQRGRAAASARSDSSSASPELDGS